MTPDRITRLSLDDERTVLSTDGDRDLVLAVGVLGLAGRLWPRDLPRAVELERAIDQVEDALTASGQPKTRRGELTTADARLQAALEFRFDGDRRSLDEVEARFQRLASASLGYPGAWSGGGGEAAAALLILRECMHHLGYAGIAWRAEAS